MKRICITLLGACLAAVSIASWAQSDPAATPRVDQRQANQERRIDEGIASGTLTAAEAKRLEKEQAVINRAEDKAKADGTVTTQERKRLHRMQDRASHDIHRQKHDRQRAGS